MYGLKSSNLLVQCSKAINSSKPEKLIFYIFFIITTAVSTETYQGRKTIEFQLRPNSKSLFPSTVAIPKNI